MNRQVLRSVCTRARPELQRPSPVPANYFSTGPWLAADSDAPNGPPRQSLRQRSRDAVGEISSILRHNNHAPAAPAAQRSQLPPAQAMRGAHNVIDVRSLPRGGLRGRDGFRGRGGAPFAPGGRFVGPPRGFAFRGGRGGRGGRATRGGRGAGRGGRRREGDEEEGQEGQVEREVEDFDIMDPYEQAFDDAMRFGTPTQYNPSLTLESLAEFMPATPSTPAGRAATALRDLSLLGAADPIGAPLDLQTCSYAQDLEAGGVRFFADAKTREETETYLQQKRQGEETPAAADKAVVQRRFEPADDAVVQHIVQLVDDVDEKGVFQLVDDSVEERIIQPADDTIRQVIVDQAIVGRHEAPCYATDPVGLARAWHLRAETYSQKDVDAFEEKLLSLLSKVGKPRAGQGAAQDAPAA